MKVLNKYSLIFFTVVLILFFSVWKIVQTEYFSNLISDKLVTKITKNLEIDLQFEKINIKILPPSIEFEKLKVSKVEEDKELSARFDRVGIHFGFLDFLANKVTIKNISLEEGLIYFYEPQKKKKRKLNLTRPY